MRVTGVSPEGNRIQLGYGLSIRLPYGVVYAKDENAENQFMIRALSPIPGNYRDGSFEIDDEDTPLWSLGMFRRAATGDYADTAESEAPNKVADALREMSAQLAKGSDTAVTEDDKRKDSFSMDDDGGYTLTSTLTIGLTGGGEAAAPVRVNEQVIYCVADMNLRIGRAGKIAYRYLFTATLDYPGCDIRMAALAIPNEDKRDEILKRRIAPILKTLELDCSKMDIDIKEPARTPEEKARREEERARLEEEQKAESKKRAADEERRKAEQERRNAEKQGVAQKKADKINAVKAERDAELKKVLAKETEFMQATQSEIAELNKRKTERTAALAGLGFFKFAEKKAEQQAISVLEAEINAKNANIAAAQSESLAKQAEIKKQFNSRLAIIKGSSVKGGGSDDAIAKALQIEKILDDEPKTANEINTALGSDYTSLQIANSVKFIGDAKSVRVRRTSTYKGATSEKEYTAYYREY